MKYDKINYRVNGKEFQVKPLNFSGKQDLNDYVKQIKTAFKKIGVEENYVKIGCGGTYEDAWAEVEWEINKQKFKFRCDMFNAQYKNMGAIAQAIQDDVRHITRGIKSLWASMRQYEALPAPEEVNKNSKYANLELSEIKKLLMVYHPDTGKKPNQEKFDELLVMMKYKKNQGDNNE